MMDKSNKAFQRDLKAVLSGKMDQLKFEKKWGARAMAQQTYKSGDRVLHEKHGTGSVSYCRNGTVEVRYDRGYDQSYILNEDLGKALRKLSVSKPVRKLTGRGAGLSPAKSKQKYNIGKHLAHAADDHYSAAYNLRHPHGLMKAIGDTLVPVFGNYREKHADKLSKTGNKLDAKGKQFRYAAYHKNNDFKDHKIEPNNGKAKHFGDQWLAAKRRGSDEVPGHRKIKNDNGEHHWYRNNKTLDSYFIYPQSRKKTVIRNI